MIKNLRKRLVAINVVSAGLVLLLAVILTFSIGYTRINNDRLSKLNAALNYKPSGSDPPASQEKLFNDIALVQYNTATGVVENWFFGEGSDLTKDDLIKYIDLIASSEDASGWIKMQVRYVKVAEGSTVRIAFDNLSRRSNNLMSYFFVTITLVVLGLASYLFISFFLAKIALKPVEQSWTKQKQFVADASHELKTPLSVIMANTDMIASHPDETVASQMKWIQNTQEETKRMALLVADLLFLAKNDDGLKVAMEDINLSETVSTVVLSYDVIFYENQKSFTYDIQPGLHISGNAGQIKQLVTILLDNANWYSKDEGNISLTLSATAKHIQLSLSNNCEQLTDEQLSHLFDRFYTVDQSRNKNNGGNGLGLSIAKVICETHGGNIVALCENSRATFTATFPVKKQH